MGVQFIGGKPGGGKTLFAVKIILNELRTSNRLIVTNVSLKLGEIAAYFREQGWNWYVGEGQTVEPWLRERILVITDDQLPEFYRYRSADGTPLPEVQGGPRDGSIDYSVVKPGGVLFVLDEVHIPFNSRRWQDTGPRVIYYLSQHRKLGDDVVLISQSIQNVDKQMRSMAQDFTYVRNLTKEKHGFFRLPGLFVRRVFLELPTGPNVKAIETGTFRLDVTGVARCYDTAAGVGIVGKSGADTQSKPRGLHWGWPVAALVLCIIGVVHYSPAAVEYLTTGGQSRHLKALAVPQKAGKELVSERSGGERRSLELPSQGFLPAPLPVGPVVNTNDVVTGLFKRGGEWAVCFKSGRLVHTAALRRLGSYFFCEGELYGCAPGL